MRQPRPNTQLARMARVLLELAEKGQDMPALSRVAEMIGVRADEASDLLRDGEKAGLWCVTRGRAGILAVFEPGGAWLMNGHAARPDRRSARPKRACLQCRTAFVPEHRYNFLCLPCGRYAARCA